MRYYSSFVLLLAVSTVFLSCTSNQQDTNLEANRAVVKKYYEIWSNGQIAELDKVMAPDYIYHMTNGKEQKGIGLTKDHYTRVRTSFPDLKDEILDMVAEGNEVTVRYKSAGTFRVKLMNFSPTGKKIVVYGVSIYRIANGKIAEEWQFENQSDFLNQLKAKN